MKGTNIEKMRAAVFILVLIFADSANVSTNAKTDQRGKIQVR